MGPAAIAQALAQLANRATKDTDDAQLPGLAVCVSMDGSVYKSEVCDIAMRASGSWQPLLLMVPLRLGLDRLNGAYICSLQSLLALPQSIGFVGGRPGKSYYFVGCQGEQLLYLDPHEVQPALSASRLDVASCHYSRGLRMMAISQIDPSLACACPCLSPTPLPSHPPPHPLPTQTSCRLTLYYLLPPIRSRMP